MKESSRRNLGRIKNGQPGHHHIGCDQGRPTRVGSVALCIHFTSVCSRFKDEMTDDEGCKLSILSFVVIKIRDWRGGPWRSYPKICSLLFRF